jgi:O-antigen ligase
MSVLLLLAAFPLVAIVIVSGFRSPLGVLVLAYAAIVPFGSATDLPIPLPPPFNTLSSLAGLVALLGMLVHLLVVRRGSASLPPAVPLWLLFLGVAGLTFAWSVDRSATADQLLLLASVMAVYVLTALMPVRQVDVQRIGTAIIAGAAMASLIGIGLFVAGRAPIGKSGVPRFLITGNDPNHTAAGLLLPLLLAISRTVDPRQRPANRTLAIGGVALMTTGILLTGSRGGVLAAVVGIVVIMLCGGSTRRAVSLVVVVGLAAALALRQAPASLEGRLVETSSTGRTDIWQLGLDTCPTYCVRGSGFGSFPAVYEEEFRTNPEGGGFRTAGFRAHNIWLQALIETGLTGLLLLVLAFTAATRDVWKLRREDRGPPLGALLALAVASSLISNLTFKYFWLVLMYAAVVVSAAGHTTREQFLEPVGTMESA